MNRLARLRRLAIGLTVVALSFTAVGAAIGAAVPAITTITPHSARQITNIDVLRQQIRNYYGDPLGSGTFAPDSYYAREARSVARSGQHWLTWRLHKHEPKGVTKAVVFDVDDTTLSTWNYELVSNWAYNPTTNAAYVNAQSFVAVPGMVALANRAAAKGYAVFFLTGRPASQEGVTLGNLTSDGIGVDAGYPQPTTLNDGEDGLFTKPPVVDYPAYLQSACAGDPNGSCTTVHYKSATRAHIESLGYDIVANFGDQFSDLKGGSADRTFKMPNPNYFLP
jgi:hypothetical protein